jgi:hypothetical protein
MDWGGAQAGVPVNGHGGAAHNCVMLPPSASLSSPRTCTSDQCSPRADRPCKLAATPVSVRCSSSPASLYAVTRMSSRILRPARLGRSASTARASYGLASVMGV